MERDGHIYPAMRHQGHFNSHAHVERDIVAATFDIELEISTHTLTWSVTISCSATDLRMNISTHTLTWSVTIGGEYVITVDGISTHTLTWSVTKT